jgi:ribosomal-protein-alanine N-acetyltransferase
VAVIRRATAADAEALTALRIANRTEYERWEPDIDDPERRYTVAGVRAWLEDGEHRFTILAGDEVAGMVSLTGVDRHVLESAMIGYFVDAAHAGRGLATAAVAEGLEFAFGELGLHRVEAGTATANIASQRVLERNGFTRVGVLRKHLRLQGEWVDHFLWERLVDD